MKTKLCDPSYCFVFPVACPVRVLGFKPPATIIAIDTGDAADDSSAFQVISTSPRALEILREDNLHGVGIRNIKGCGVDVFRVTDTERFAVDIRLGHGLFSHNSLFTPYKLYKRGQEDKPKIMMAEHVVLPQFRLKRVGRKSTNYVLEYQEPGSAIGEVCSVVGGMPNAPRDNIEFLVSHFMSVEHFRSRDLGISQMPDIGKTGEFDHYSLVSGLYYYTLKEFEARIETCLKAMSGILPEVGKAIDALSPERDKKLCFSICLYRTGKTAEVTLLEKEEAKDLWFGKFQLDDTQMKCLEQFIANFRFATPS